MCALVPLARVVGELGERTRGRAANEEEAGLRLAAGGRHGLAGLVGCLVRLGGGDGSLLPVESRAFRCGACGRGDGHLVGMSVANFSLLFLPGWSYIAI